LEKTIMQRARIYSSVPMVGEVTEVEAEVGNSFCKIWRTKLE